MSEDQIKFRKKNHDNHEHKHDCHGHTHDHHDHNHHELPKNYTNAFIIGIGLNLIFTIIEFSYGIISKSLALVADAGHNLSDVLGLVIALIATLLIKKNANRKFTFGLRASTILSALLNSTLLFIAVGAILWEAIHRLSSTVEIQSNTMMIVAGIGIIINFTTAMFFHSHSHNDLNAKGAYLHLISDAAISLGVVITGFLIKKTGLIILDPIVSIIISLIIIYGTWNLFKEALYLTLNAVPEKIDMDQVSLYLLSLEGVSEVHDLHVWAISTTENALTAHLIIPEIKFNDDQFLKNIESHLKTKFNIHHTTIQIEKNSNHEHYQNTCFRV
jgi:cobalt-zinc-cadmium efflux system protein